MYFVVLLRDRDNVIVRSGDGVPRDGGGLSEMDIVARSGQVRSRTPSIAISGDDGERRDVLDLGDSLTLSADGLRPFGLYDADLLADGRRLFNVRLLADGSGTLEPTAIWPQIGLDDPNRDVRFTIDEGLARWRDVALTVRLKEGKKRIADGRVRISSELSRPMVLVTDAEGRLCNAVERGKDPLFVTVRNLPFTGEARLFLVARQHDWGVGDRLLPALQRHFEAPDGGRELTLEVAAPEELVSGAYDMVVRSVRYGFEEDEALRLLRTDIVSSRRLTGLVVRENFWRAKPVLGGCVNKIAMSGRTVTGAPYFHYSDTFAVGENVYAALDPGIVDPGNLSKMCALYVVQNKTAGQWAASNSLNHVVGGNGAVQKLKLQAGCVNANIRLVWPAAPTEGEYDLVADFGNNTPDANAFVPDDAYQTPLDIIDGYFNVGFRVVRDPGTMTDYAHVGAWDYDEASVTALGITGTVTVQDEAGFYSSPGAITTTTVNVPLRAHVRFPADAAGATTPGQISGAQPSFPLVVVVHGNGHSYTSYDFLLEHLAANGFIAASIHLNGGMAALGRANVFFEHVTALQLAFGAKLQNTIGVMGHSRGGEGVVKIARLNQQLGLGLGIQAVISLAPTDQYGREVFSGAWAVPYFVLYGSADGDVAGWATTEWGGYLANLGFTWRMTGFSLFDRASGMKKSMGFVYGATHNGFVTTNEASPAIPETSQRAVTLAYTNAFFRQYLRNEPKWAGMFTGEWKPPSVTTTGARLFLQYQDPSRRTVDDFEGGAPNWQQSTIGGTVGDGGTLPVAPNEGRLNNDPNAPGLDLKSPHDSKGILVRWDNLGDHLDFDLPVGQRDVTAFSYVSMRMTQRADSVHNPSNQPQNFRVALLDGNGKQRAVRASAFAEIPYPDVRPYADHTKSALTSVRIPLTAYTIVCAGLDPVSLSDVIRVSVLFSENAAGEVEIDDLEFTN